MTNDDYPPLRPQPPVRERPSSIPWLPIVGVTLLGILAIVLLALLLGNDDGTAGASPTLSADPSASGAASSVPSGSPGSSAGASAAASAGASAAPGTPLAVDTIAEAVADRISIRADPGLGGERLGSLALGSPSYVAAGPTDADGYQWYLVSGLGLPPNSGCAAPAESDPFNCPFWFGWVAAASDTGEPWLAPADAECPSTPLTAEGLILAQTNLQRLACLGAEPFTFRGWWPEIPDDAGQGGSCTAQDEPSGWLLCQNININHVMINENEGFGGVGAAVSIDPASGVTMPERGTWIELTVHLDDPAADGCDEAAQALEEQDRPPEQYVLDCRAEMVVESVTAVDGP